MRCDVTTFEVELEQEKTEKIAAVAARGAVLAREFGQDPDDVQDFLRHYFRHVDAIDVDERRVEDLLGLVASHYRAAVHRPAARAVIMIRTPSQSDDGWTAGGATVVQIVTDDRPFLVDSVTMELLRQGWSIRDVFHPQFLVRRDLEGTLRGIVRSSEAAHDPAVTAESWMHVEILPPARPESPDTLVPELERGLLEVLRLVEEAVEDWQKMITRSEETIQLLKDPMRIAGRTDEAARARELLAWLNANHFTFLGYREYELVDRQGDGQRVLEPVPATGLGILRADQDVPGAFHALPQPGTRHDLMIITKDDHKSRVHRPAYLDYLGIRTFDGDGRVIGERRFLGLFSSSAYSESVTRVPVLRQKAEAVLERSGYGEQSHGGKAIMDVLDTFPRDELFQSPTGRAGHGGGEGRSSQGAPPGADVRPPRSVRSLPVLSGLPAPGPLHHLGAATDGRDPAPPSSAGNRSTTPPGSPSRCWRGCTSSSGCRSAKRWARSTYARLEKELTLATRSWNDEFADMIADADQSDQLATLVGALPEGYKEDYTPVQAVQDLTALTTLAGDHDMSMALYAPSRAVDEADLRLKIFRRDASMALSRILPHLTLLGVDVIDERPYELALGNDRARVHLRPGGHGSRWGGSGSPPLDHRGAAAVHGRVRRLVRGSERTGRLQRAGDGRRSLLARRQPAAHRRSLPAPGRRHLQPDLHRPGARARTSTSRASWSGCSRPASTRSCRWTRLLGRPGPTS